MSVSFRHMCQDLATDFQRDWALRSESGYAEIA